MEKKPEKPTIRKNLDLPRETVEQLKAKAKEAHMLLKPYVEKTLIDHAKNPFKK